MSVYQQPAEQAAAPLAAGPAPAIDVDDDRGNPFPPAWVKTAEDYEAWAEAKVRKTLENPGPRLSNEEAWARMDRYIAEFRQAKAQRDAAGA